MNSLTIGADPEVFLIDREGQYRSSIGLIGGSKRQPRQLERAGFALQEDNVATEFNIPPATNLAEFVESIQWSIKRIETEVEPKGLKVAIVPAAHFEESELKHPNALNAGCDPDYNAWTKCMNPRPMVQAGTLRTGAGHVHIGVTSKPRFSRETFVKSLDLNLGVGSILYDTDVLRKQLYGKAGAFRPTSYGLEYRVLSNFWLHSAELMKWVYEQTHAAYQYAEEYGEKFFNDIGSDIVECINTSNKSMAEALMKRHGIASV